MRLPRRHVRVGVMAVLLAMLLMRLVWMELRHYRFSAPWLPPADAVHALALPEAAAFPAARTSPVWELLRQEYFPRGVFLGERFRNAAEFEIVIVVAMAVGITRLLAHSWLAALFVGVGIMSRGRLLAAVEAIDPGLMLAAFFSLWCAASIWAIRTGVKLAAGLAMGVGFVLMLLEPAFVPLALAWPLFLPRPGASGGVPAETGAFRPLAVEFHDLTRACGWRRALIPLHVASMVLAGIALVSWWLVHHPGIFAVASALPEGFTRLWIQTLAESWDIELTAASLMVTTVFLLGRHRFMAGLSESIQLVLIASILVLFGSWAVDAWESMVYPMSIFSFRAARAWIWLEPPLLTMGAVTLFQLAEAIRDRSRRDFQVVETSGFAPRNCGSTKPESSS